MSMRGKVENWRSQVSEDFDEQLAESITEIQTAIQQGNELITWFRKCIPTIAEYTGEEGKTSFTDDDVITETTDDGAVISQRIDQHYFSIVNLFNGFITRWQNTINDYQDEIDLYNDNPLGDLISAVEGLGLEQTFEDSNDGYLWFTDPETHQIYFISVYNKVAAIGGQVHVLDNFGYKRNIDNLNWKSNWHVDLVHTAIIWYPGSIRPFHSVASDYFGAYDSLRRWIAASIEKGNTPPEFYPSHLVTSTGTANPNV